MARWDCFQKEFCKWIESLNTPFVVTVRGRCHEEPECWDYSSVGHEDSMCFEIYENWYTKQHRKQKTTHRTLLAKRSVSNWHIRIKKQNTQGNDAILAIWKRWNIIGFILSPRGRSLSRTIVHWLSKYTRAAAWLEALFHSRSRIVPDHWPEKQKKESLHQQTTLDHMLWQSRRTHLQAEKNNNTLHSRSQWERQHIVAVPQSGSAPSAALLTNHPWNEPSSNAPTSGHLKQTRSLSNSYLTES